jgi:hypothetical protein
MINSAAYDINKAKTLYGKIFYGFDSGFGPRTKEISKVGTVVGTAIKNRYDSTT